jgi:hypothetical protein
MVNFKEYAATLHTSKEFVLSSIQFLGIKDVLTDYKKDSRINTEKAKELKDKCKTSRQLAISALNKALPKEVFLEFLEAYPAITNTQFAKFIIGQVSVKEKFRSLYEASYNYTARYLINDLTPEDIDNYKKNIYELRQFFSTLYNW